MNRLLLVKHGAPQIIENLPSAEWTLSEPGKRQCEALPAGLAEFRPGAVLASTEPKAFETATILAAALGLPAISWSGLHENDRTGLPFFSDAADLDARMQAFFARPSERVIGKESADEAHERFAGAVRRALASRAEECLVCVSHGTVISLLVARATGQDPYPLWRQMGFTSFAVLDAATLELQKIVHPPHGRRGPVRRPPGPSMLRHGSQ